MSNISNFGLDMKNKFIQLCLQKTSSDARPWTHHQCCFQESLGVSSLTTDTLVLATQPRLIRPRPVSKWHSTAPTALPSSTTAIWTLFLLPPHCCLHGSSSVSTCYAQRAIGLAQGVTSKSPAAHIYWHTPGPPSVLLTILHQFLVFLPLSLLSLLHPLLPGHCQLHQDQLFCGLRDQDDVRSQFGLGNVCWNFQLPFQVDCHCPVSGCGEQTYRAVFRCFCPSLMN